MNMDTQGIDMLVYFKQALGVLLAKYAPAVVAALLILVIGRWVARLLTKMVRKLMERAALDETLTNFLANTLYFALLAFVVVAAVSKLGVETASFIAILGAAGFAVGFALQGSLANFASGVMLMIFRPMKRGDLVEAGGVLGVVDEIGMFATTINTLENRRAIIANATITGGNIINYTANGSLRVDMTFGISYGDDIDKAISVMQEVLEQDPKVLKDPEPTVAVLEHGASAVRLVCRPWCDPEHYWDVYFNTQKRVKEEFDKVGITIPFPQQDVHLHRLPA
jgi:small conductance mechanosensitive channel